MKSGRTFPRVGMRALRWLGVLGVVALTVGLVVPATGSASQLYVANQNTNTISPFSIAADGSLSPIACSGSNCNTGVCPEQVTMTPDGRFLYTTNCVDGTVSEFSVAADGSLSPLCTGTGCPSTGTDSGPLGAAVTPNGRFLVVAGTGTNGTDVSAFSIAADGTLAPISCPGSNCSVGASSFLIGLAVSPDGRFVYVIDEHTGTVREFAIAADGTLTPLCTSSCPGTGSVPFSVAVTPNGKFLYVGNRNHSISPFSINADGTLTAISCPSTNCQTRNNPNGVTVSPGGQFLYVPNELSNTISVFAIAADGSISPVSCAGCATATGSNPSSLAITPNGRFLYDADENNGDPPPGTVEPFTINADGTLSAISCTAPNCNTGGGQDVFEAVVSPDQAPVAALGATPALPGSASTFNGSGSTAAPGQTVARYDWSFGDGTTAPNGGPTPTHTYSTPGTYTVTLTVTDDAGCSTQQVYTGQTMSCNGGPSATMTRLVTISGPPPVTISGPPPVTISGPPPVTISPALSSPKVSPKKLSIAGRKVHGRCVKPTKKNHSNAHCLRAIKLKISYTLNVADTVTFKVKRRAPGRKIKASCVKPTKRNSRHRKCTRLIGLHGTLVEIGNAGANTFSWNGKIGGHKLGPGTYQLTATPTGGKPQTVTFTIVG